jgi:hypothetical protein
MNLLSGNPLTSPPEKFRDLKSERLILSGKDYVKGQSVASILCGGVLGRNKTPKKVWPAF